MTLPLEEDARAFCHKLLDARLAAGINILGPCHSMYHWDGKMHEKDEWVLLAQVAKNVYADFQKTVLDLHPYHIPCVLGISVEEGPESLLKWINNPAYTGQ